MRRAHGFSLLFCVAVLSTISATAQAQLAYRLTPIIDPSSSNYGYPSGINNRGEVIGHAETFGFRGFHWKNGVYTDLLTATGSEATALIPSSINDRSIIIGVQDAEPRNFMIRDGELRALRISAADGITSVSAINNRNQIAGRGQTSVFIWEKGTTTFLPKLPGSDDFVTAAAGINDRGVVVGTSGTIDVRRAVIWKDGEIIALDLLPDTIDSEGKAINNFDQVIGDARSPGIVKPFFWDSGTTTELNPPPGGIASTAWAMNDWGAVVGDSTMSIDGAVHATLWVAGRGHDLNTLVDANEPLRDTVILVQALYINERGQIVAYGVHHIEGTRVLYLLTPTYRAPALAE
jgi:probable HAF family extracellular repeat protein